MPDQGGYTQVATDDLVTYGRRRFEESYAYDAVGKFIMDVSDVSHWAWSYLPWSNDWRNGWEESWGHRATEARKMAEVMGRTGGNLLQVAADYMDTDVEAALRFTVPDLDTGEETPLLEGPTSAYLEYYGPYGDEIVATPGDQALEPEFREPPQYHDYPPDRPPPSGIPYPSDYPGLQQLREEQRPPGVSRFERPPRQVPITGPGGGYMEEVDQPPGYQFDGPEQDRLDEFVQEYGEQLIRIEDTARGLGGSERPWTDLLEPAWLSCPSVIKHRAELLGSAEKAYEDLAGGLQSETNWLDDSWGGPAATAYFSHATDLKNHLLGPPPGLLAAIAETVKQSKQAATVLTELRLAYADIGYQKIQHLIDRYNDYVAASTNLLGEVATCGAPGSAAKALLLAVQEFNTVAGNEEKRRIEEARALLRPDSIANQLGPEFPSGPLSIPDNALRSDEKWNDGNEWETS